MAKQIVVPEMGESVVEATVAQWHKKVGDSVAVNDVLVSLETDKVSLDVVADASGVLASIEQLVGSEVKIGGVLGSMTVGERAAASVSAPVDAPPSTNAPAVASANVPAAAQASAVNATPVAKRVAAAEGVDLSQLQGSGSKGQITKQDVLAAVVPPLPVLPTATASASSLPVAPVLSLVNDSRREERVRLSRRRRTIAQRLVAVQHTAASLTTFNEVDLSAVMDLRKRQQDTFTQREGVKLGFMSFFVKAVIGALKQFPRLNAEITDDEMVLKKYYDIGIAVSAEEGLVVPVIRDADRQSFGAIERQIRDLATKARDGKLGLGDLAGGTFTITNGGTFGSMLSTPILNAPQVGILGMHNIVERPVVVQGQVVIRPIMYVALTYDHRIVDGSEAVRFLVAVKRYLENPEELLLAA